MFHAAISKIKLTELIAQQYLGNNVRKYIVKCRKTMKLNTAKMKYRQGLNQINSQHTYFSIIDITEKNYEKVNIRVVARLSK